MRTTLDIEDDLLMAAKELARREGKSAGKVVSELMRKGLTGGSLETGTANNEIAEKTAHYGLRPFASRGKIVTNEQINELRDELGI